MVKKISQTVNILYIFAHILCIYRVYIVKLIVIYLVIYKKEYYHTNLHKYF